MLVSPSWRSNPIWPVNHLVRRLPLRWAAGTWFCCWCAQGVGGIIIPFRRCPCSSSLLWSRCLQILSLRTCSLFWILTQRNNWFSLFPSLFQMPATNVSMLSLTPVHFAIFWILKPEAAPCCPACWLCLISWTLTPKVQITLFSIPLLLMAAGIFFFFALLPLLSLKL